MACAGAQWWSQAYIPWVSDRNVWPHTALQRLPHPGRKQECAQLAPALPAMPFGPPAPLPFLQEKTGAMVVAPVRTVFTARACRRNRRTVARHRGGSRRFSIASASGEMVLRFPLRRARTARRLPAPRVASFPYGCSGLCASPVFMPHAEARAYLAPFLLSLAISTASRNRSRGRAPRTTRSLTRK